MSLGRSTRAMALGTVASRGSGFLRTAVIAAVLGLEGVPLAYNVANTAPNIVYELLLGGVLTAVVVPLLVRAAKEDGDGGQAYAQRLLTLVVLVLGGAAAVLVVAAPLIVDLYLPASVGDPDRDLAVTFARYFLPQVLFYGAGAVMAAILNTRGRFGAPMWTPVLNNVVVIGTGLVFLGMRGGADDVLTSVSITSAQVVVLGIGTTLGIVVQTLALVPSLRAAGFRFRPRFDFRGTGLGQAGRLAKWVFLYVAVNQLAYLVVVRLGSDALGEVEGRNYNAYVYAFVLWQLPHAVVAVSVITALLPRMARAAADDRIDDLRATLNRGLRLTVSLLVPAAVAFVVLGREIATVVYGRGQIPIGSAQFIGVLLGVFALGLVPFSTYQLQQRAFYALQDTRTPALISIGVSATMIAADLLLYALLPTELKIVGLAAGHALSFYVGLVICSRLLSRRLGGLEHAVVVRTFVRCVVAAVPPALLALLVARASTAAIGEGPLGALVGLGLGGLVLGLGYLLLARRLRVPEVEEAVAPLLSRLRR